jgi:hypothetical protein
MRAAARRIRKMTGDHPVGAVVQWDEAGSKPKGRQR